MTTEERLLRYNAWATRVLLDRCRSLTPEQFRQRFDIGPGSLHDALRHVISAMRRWTDRLSGRPAAEPIGTSHTPDELLALLDHVDRELGEVLGAVARDDRLDELMSVEFTPKRFTRGTALVHVFAHGVHHRAQALNMLRRLGVTDLPELEAWNWGSVPPEG